MVGTLAAREADPLFKTKTAISCHLLHWYLLLVSLTSGAYCDTGAPGVGKKTQCALLCRILGFQHISMDDVLREKSDDPSYSHAQFVKDCLEEKVEVPRELKISLLERKINEGIEEGRKWSLVEGFPECTQELLELEQKVGFIHVNGTLLTFGSCKNLTTVCF